MLSTKLPRSVYIFKNVDSESINFYHSYTYKCIFISDLMRKIHDKKQHTGWIKIYKEDNKKKNNKQQKTKQKTTKDLKVTKKQKW